MKKRHNKEKIKKNIKDRTDLIMFLLFCVFTLSFTVGYAALNQDLKISGEAVFRVKEDIRITNVSLYETTNLGLENYNSKYSKNTISLGVDLKELSSTITYKVEIVNSGNVSMWIDSITQEINNNSNMEYVLEGIGIKELINPGDIKEFNLKIKYKDNITSLPENTNLDTTILFNFLKPISVLALGTTGNSDGDLAFFNGPIARNKVETFTFMPTLEVGENAIGYWDASYEQNGTVIAWYTDNDNDKLYELYIGGNGDVVANENSQGVFNCFTNLTKINFNNAYDTSNATNFTKMFNYATSLENLDLSSFNTSNVDMFTAMFQKASSLTSIDLSNFDTSNAIDMKYMFNECNELTSLDLSNFDTSKVIDMKAFLQNCNKLSVLNISSFNTSNVTNMSFMFNGCNNLVNLDINNFNTQNVVSMSSMFSDCNALTTLNISNFNTSKVTDMSYMFHGCYVLENLDISNFNTINVTNMTYMFNRCESLVSLDVSNFNTSNVTNMRAMFSSLKKLSNITVNNFNTSKVTDMSYMFFDCYVLENLDLSSFDTSNVTTMFSMFAYNHNNKNINVSSFNTLNVTDMNSMFRSCDILDNLDISNFNTSNVTNMSYMFSGDFVLNNLDIRSFDFTSVTESTSIFNSIPVASLITVKDQTAYDFVIGARSDLTNVQIASA